MEAELLYCKIFKLSILHSVVIFSQLQRGADWGSKVTALLILISLLTHGKLEESIVRLGSYSQIDLNKIQ
jgi:mannitol/fructose-specific phosphotransferase system IIA component